MKKLLFIMIFLVVTLCGKGQKIFTNSVKASQVMALMQSYQYNRAIMLADRFLADSLSTEILLLKGQSLEALFRYKEAIRTLQTARHYDSLNFQILNEIVTAYRQSGDNDSAVLINQGICKSNPENSFFTLQLANLYYTGKNYSNAKSIFCRLFQKDTTSLFIIKQLAYCYEETGSLDSAEYFYDHALRLMPNDPVLTSRLANLLIKDDRVNEAYGVTAAFLKHNPPNSSILKINAYCNYLIHDYENASKQLRKCINMGDSSKFVRKYLGLSFYKQEKYDSAAPLFLSLYKNDTTDAENSFYYGVSMVRIFALDTGILFLNRTLRNLSPYSKFLSSSFAELASAFSHSNQPDTGLVLLQKANQLDPGNNYLQFKIAYQYDYYLRKPYKALPYYREFLKNVPPTPETDHERNHMTPVPNGIPEIIGSCVDYSKNRIREISVKK